MSLNVSKELNLRVSYKELSLKVSYKELSLKDSYKEFNLKVSNKELSLKVILSLQNKTCGVHKILKYLIRSWAWVEPKSWA